MPPTVQQIKEQLLKAIDEDANVLDLAGVVEVITTLEKYPVTKEALEETRLGKLVNEIRRKTNNDDLSKRCRKLVKLWQNLCIPQAPNQNRLPRSGSSTPLNGSNVSSSSQKTSQSKGNKTPDVRPQTTQALGKTYTADRKKRRAAEHSTNSPDWAPAEKKIASSYSPHFPGSHSDSDLVNGLPSCSDKHDAKTFAGSSSTTGIQIKSRTPNLPSTSQFSSQSSLSPRSVSHSSKHSSKIHKSDSAPELKSKAHTSTSSKEEHLKSSFSDTLDCEASQSNVQSTDESLYQFKNDSIHIHSESYSEKKSEKSECVTDVEKIESTSEGVEGLSVAEAVSREPVTSEDVDRLHREQWEGVSGCFDSKGEWHEWNECLEVNTDDDNVLHILPYVVLN
ncbi:mediator of RNA polymerase II transcription subunit 26-like [Ptychodera flava]|uniref:mediator of RNA polymerase II transcription subunit 26-like n=1 Tax=Ptychodera flava TaxID=63121 RepID=UPI00396A61DC